MGGNCTTATYGVCADAVYPNIACKFGHHCDRQNEYYWVSAQPVVVATGEYDWVITFGTAPLC